MDMKVYCALYSSEGRILGEEGKIYFHNKNIAEIELPDGTKYFEDIKSTDNRILFVFDGLLEEGLLPAGCDILKIVKTEFLVTKKSTFRNGCHSLFDLKYIENNNEVKIAIHRYFILLHSQVKTIVFRIRPITLSIQGLFVETDEKSIRFKTTTY